MPFTPTSSGITELGLGYVRIRHSGSTAPGLVESDLEQDWVGTAYCPYISHLVVGPDQTDVDEWLARMKSAFISWFDTVQDELNIDTSIQVFQRTVVGSKTPNETTHVISGTKQLEISSQTISGYSYDDNDVIFVYYNGLFLAENEEWSRTPGFVNLYNGVNTDNVINIIILKTQMGGGSLPNGNGIYY